MSLVTIAVHKTFEFVCVLFPDCANRNVAYLVDLSDFRLRPAFL